MGRGDSLAGEDDLPTVDEGLGVGYSCLLLLSKSADFGCLVEIEKGSTSRFCSTPPNKGDDGGNW